MTRGNNCAGWVYFVQGVDGGPIKIGCSTNVGARLRDLQGASPTRLRIIGVIPSADMLADEASWHRQHAAYRLLGEWFEPAATLTREIGDQAVPYAAEPHAAPGVRAARAAAERRASASTGAWRFARLPDGNLLGAQSWDDLRDMAASRGLALEEMPAGANAWECEA